MLNGADFETKLAEVQATDVTMVRDTDQGMRYLVKKEGSAERVVKEGFDSNKLFLLGGVFYDDALDYPLPLAGVNYFSFDVNGTGQQANLFFGGALLQGNLAQPSSRHARRRRRHLLALASTSPTRSRWRHQARRRDVAWRRRASPSRRPAAGSFFRLGASYASLAALLRRRRHGVERRVPSDHFLHPRARGATLAPSTGSRRAAFNQRSTWEPWGLPNTFDPATRDFERWGVRAAKSWYLPRFQRLGLEVDYLGGRDLDRFSKYQFGFFGASRVHGYQSGKVRAEKALATHLSYGVGVGEVVRLDLIGDAAWATDEASGLDRELLGGIGLAGSFMGPWQTVVQIDVGTPVAGPDSGFVAYLVFLKLFK